MSEGLKIYSSFKAVGETTDDGKIFIEGYANTTTKDRGRDFIYAEAWEKNTLEAFMKNPILLYMHDSRNAVGQVTELSATEGGLYIKGWCYSDSSLFSEGQKVKDGVLRTLSVHFDTDWRNVEYDEKADTWYIKKIDDLYEISITTVPMNADSTFSVAKSLGQEKFKELKNNHKKEHNMSLLENLKGLFAKKKSGELTEKESQELKDYLNQEEVKSLIKSLTEEAESVTEVAEDVAQEEPTSEVETEVEVEETESEKALRVEREKSAKLEQEKAELEKKLKASNAKPKGANVGDPNPTGDPSTLTDQQKRDQAIVQEMKNAKTKRWA